ncbi:hypothetical protein BGX38DRAFT_1212283 [Terfezia claveryi]|nr:hypothetical protein BGX38DRAFT_1212283 [Terfezia claveryi]
MDAASPSTLWGSNVYVLPHPHGRRRRGRRRSARQLQRSMSIRPRLLWISLLGIALFLRCVCRGSYRVGMEPRSRWSRPRRDGQPYTKARVKELRSPRHVPPRLGQLYAARLPADEVHPIPASPPLAVLLIPPGRLSPSPASPSIAHPFPTHKPRPERCARKLLPHSHRHAFYPRHLLRYLRRR